MTRYHWKTLCPGKESFHLVRARLKGTAPHGHDFPELFWIEKGRVIHRVNGREFPLTDGDLVFIRKTDCHALRSLPRSDFVIANIAFPHETLEFLRSRYFSGERRWFWKTGPEPDLIHLDHDRLARMTRWVARLAGGGRSRLDLEIFLMELFRDLAEAQSPREPADGPEWLIKALHAITDPTILTGGTAALARRAGRTPQHLNASLKKWRGITATDAINEARMEVAARELRTSTKKIIEICFDCGLQNLAHFYKLFQKKHGTTPRLYRAQHHAVIRP